MEILGFLTALILPAACLRPAPVQGVEGQLQPLPASLAHLEGQGRQLVVWDVRGSHRSFGQLLLLGRAVHCVQLLERSLSLRSPVDGEALRDLEEGVALMAGLCGQRPALVADMMSLTVSAGGMGEGHGTRGLIHIYKIGDTS